MNEKNISKEQLVEELNALRREHSLLQKRYECLEKNSKKIIPFICKMNNILEGFISNSSEKPDYDLILNAMQEISGAKFSALNFILEDAKSSITVALGGLNSSILKASNLLGFSLIEKVWEYDYNKFEATKNQIITKFDALVDLTIDSIPKSISKTISSLFSLGSVYVIRITKDEKLIGDFTLFFEQGHEIENSALVELYSNQVGLFLDRNRAITKLFKSEELYRNLVERIPDGVYKSTHEGKFIEVNKAMVSILGYDTKEELMNLDIKKDLYFEEEERYCPAIFDNKKNLDIYRLKKKDGTEAWVEDHGWYVYDNDGNIVFHEGIIRDITDRKYVEDNLRSSEERYRLFIDSTMDMVFLKDENFRYVIVNEALASYSKVKMEEMIGKTDFDFKDREEAENIKISDIQVLSSDYVVHFEDVSEDKIYDIRKFRVPLGEGKFGIGGYIRDITEIKISSEKLIKLSKELKEINATKDKLFSIIAHDLKSPFNSIYGFSRILSDQVRNKDINQVEKFAKIIMDSSEAATRLLGNLIEWSQSQIGVLQPKIESFNLKLVADEVILIYSNLASFKQIDLSNEVNSHLNIRADKAMINTVLRNLVENAIKFSNKNGKVEISAKVIDDSFEVCVKDYGVGISLERLNTIFDVNNSNSTEGTLNEKGTGLGLLLCKEFIEKQKGRIWIKSEEGKGSEFYFSIPK